MVSKPYIMPDDPEEGSTEALAKEAAETRDKMLRTLAEMENLRKRTEREVTDARTYGIAAFARDISTSPTIAARVDAVRPKRKADADAGLKALIEGVELTERVAAQGAGEARRQKLDPTARSSTRTCIRRCTRCRTRRFPPACRASHSGRLHDRRTRAAPGTGRDFERRRESGAPAADVAS